MAIPFACLLLAPLPLLSDDASNKEDTTFVLYCNVLDDKSCVVRWVNGMLLIMLLDWMNP